MLRRTPLKRSPFKRKGAKPTDHPEHLAWLRKQPCALAKVFGMHCWGEVQAHHSTIGRGLSQRSSDLEAFPLCQTHHSEFHNANGVFRYMGRAERRDWQLQMSERYRPKETA